MKQQQLEKVLKEIVYAYENPDDWFNKTLSECIEEAKGLLPPKLNRAQQRRIANGGKDGGPYE